MAEPRIPLLLCILVFCLPGSGFIRGQKVSGSQSWGTGRDRAYLCMDGLGGINAAGTCLTSLRAQIARLLSQQSRLKSVAVLPEVQGYSDCISSNNVWIAGRVLWAASHSVLPSLWLSRDSSSPILLGSPKTTVYAAHTWWGEGG